jgi:hypothetical protein
MVRRRAVYVAGNLNLDKLAPALARRLAITDEGDTSPSPGASGSGMMSSAAISLSDLALLADEPAAPTGNPPDIRLAAYVALGADEDLQFLFRLVHQPRILPHPGQDPFGQFGHI